MTIMQTTALLESWRCRPQQPGSPTCIIKLINAMLFYFAAVPAVAMPLSKSPKLLQSQSLIWIVLRHPLPKPLRGVQTEPGMPFAMV
jgi:hypothetical protein